jgi:hypothetical protein
MARSILKAALIAGIAVAGGSGAFAQFGSIFGDPPPRPPGSVGPGSAPDRQPLPPPPQQNPTQSYPSGPFGRPQPQSYPSGSSGGAQSQPLPPPGAAPRPARVPPQPADTSVQPGDEVIAAPPAQKIVNPQAVFSGLDKITGRIINFDVAIGETVQFGALQLTTRACYTRPLTETANTDAFVEVDEVTLQGEVKRIFTGWMFASSPGLHAVEHPIYDLWLTDCKGGAQTVAADAGEPPPRAAAPQQKRAPQAKQQPQQQQQRRPPPPQQSYPPFR